MARKLTLEFTGLCAYVRDRKAPDPAGQLTVLMLDAKKAGMRGHPRHAPQMEIPSRAIRRRSGKGSGNGTSVLNLAGRAVEIQTTGKAKLAFGAAFQKVASLESIREGFGLVDGKCMQDKRPRRVIAARIRMTGGKVTAEPQKGFASMEWRFQPPSAQARGPQVLADTVRVTVAGKSGPFSILLTDLKTGKVKRQIRIDPSAAATIEFRNEPVRVGKGHVRNVAQAAPQKASHFAACYEVSAKGRGLARRKRPIPVLASGGQASGHAQQGNGNKGHQGNGHKGHRGKMTGQVAAYVASSATVFCPGATLYQGP